MHETPFGSVVGASILTLKPILRNRSVKMISDIFLMRQDRDRSSFRMVTDRILVHFCFPEYEEFLKTVPNQTQQKRFLKILSLINLVFSLTFFTEFFKLRRIFQSLSESLCLIQQKHR